MNNAKLNKKTEIKQKTKQIFGKKTNNQEYYYDSLSGKLLGCKTRENLILKKINKLKKDDYFLEVGCAQGHYLKKAFKKTKNVFGIDISKEFITKAKKTGANVQITSGEKLPFKNNFFNFVLCTETIEHIPNWKKSIKEIKRVLKKNGLVIITIPLEKSLFWRIFSIFFSPEKTRGHINLLTSIEIENEFVPLKLIEKKYIQTMSQTLNKFIPQKEKISMYAFFVFKK
ncbi:MAG: class I SAM-dependent methyltransferase [Candidatus ainarchaeum sp.]|nr:class I SAM-dependent methyltransferase [Candidatus ainarchaeum sp.]